MSGPSRERMPLVAVAREYFCHVSEGFIHRHVIGLKRYRAVVLARLRLNSDLFPYHDVVLGEPARWLPARVVYHLLRAGLHRVGLPPVHVNRRFSAVLRARRPLLIHAHFGWSGVDVMALARRHAIPLIITAHGSDVNSLASGGHRYRERLVECFGIAARVLCVSDFIAGRVRALGCPAEKIRVLRVGVPIPPAPTRATAKQVRFVAVGRLVPVKNPLSTLEAFRIVYQQAPGARLCLIGDGPLREEVRAFIREHGLAGAVQLLGQIPHRRVYEEMGQANIFVQHSVCTHDGQEEGFPLTFAEAAAHGLPSVGTESGGTSEAVLDGTTGFLVPERDVQAMAQRMLTLATDARLRSEMGLAARAYAVKHLDVEKQNAKLEALYDEIRASASG